MHFENVGGGRNVTRNSMGKFRAAGSHQFFSIFLPGNKWRENKILMFFSNFFRGADDSGKNKGEGNVQRHCGYRRGFGGYVPVLFWGHRLASIRRPGKSGRSCRRPWRGLGWMIRLLFWFIRSGNPSPLIVLFLADGARPWAKAQIPQHLVGILHGFLGESRSKKRSPTLPSIQAHKLSVCGFRKRVVRQAHYK